MTMMAMGAKIGITIEFNKSAIMPYNEERALVIHDKFNPHVVVLKLFPSIRS